MQLNHAEFIAIVIAFACLVSGLFIFFKLVSTKKTNNFHSANLIAWLLIALFPAILLFILFPGNKAEGTVLGISVSGSLAVFFMVWLYGSQQSIKARKSDELEKIIKELHKTIELQKATIESIKNLDDQNDVISKKRIISYRFRAISNKSIALITGRLENIKEAEIWVNSENTNMQMARFYERTISSVIRYMGAVKDEFGNVSKDVIAEELAQALKGCAVVEPTTVIMTSAGELEQTNNVKKIFHVAAVRGEIGQGYVPIQDIEKCITRSLQKADSNALNFKSILFPLIGTGTGKASFVNIVPKLIGASVAYISHYSNSSINTIFFLTFTESHVTACINILDGIEELEQVG